MPEPTVLILEPESSGVDLIPAAVGLGFDVTVVDRRPTRELPTAVRTAVDSRAATHLRVDTRSAGAVADAAAVLAARRPIVAVVPAFEYAVPVAAETAARLGLPGITARAAGLLRDKSRMKQKLAAARVPVAQGMPVAVARADDALVRHIARRVGFPAVVKPVDGCGSLRVRRVEDLAQLREEVALSRREPVDDMGLRLGGRLLVERYVSGPEVSVEGYAVDGAVHIVAVTEKQLGPEPYFVEVGHVVDAGLTQRERSAVEDVARKSVEALGVTVGAFHVEARLTPSGPVVMEAAARLGGDRIQQLVLAAHGFDLPGAMVRALAGLPVPPPAPDRSRRVAGVRFFTVPRPAVLDAPELVRERVADVARATGTECLELSVDATAGRELRPAADFRDRFGHAMFAAAGRPGLDAALALVDKGVEQAVRSPTPCAY